MVPTFGDGYAGIDAPEAQSLPDFSFLLFCNLPQCQMSRFGPIMKFRWGTTQPPPTLGRPAFHLARNSSGVSLCPTCTSESR